MWLLYGSVLRALRNYWVFFFCFSYLRRWSRWHQVYVSRGTKSSGLTRKPSEQSRLGLEKYSVSATRRGLTYTVWEKKNESVVGLSRWRWVDTSDTPIYRLLYWSSTSLNRVSSHVVKVRYRSDFIDPNDNKTNHCFNVLFKIYATISFFFLDFYLQILSNQFIHNILYIF